MSSPECHFYDIRREFRQKKLSLLARKTKILEITTYSEFNKGRWPKDYMDKQVKASNEKMAASLEGTVPLPQEWSPSELVTSADLLAYCRCRNKRWL